MNDENKLNKKPVFDLFKDQLGHAGEGLGVIKNSDTEGTTFHTVDGDFFINDYLLKKYISLGGPAGFLGCPITNTKKALDGRGRYAYFQHGALFYHKDTGVHEIHGHILDKWKLLNLEAGILGYPLTDETATPDGVGHFSCFQGGAIYLHPETGAHEIYGVIRDTWEGLGGEKSDLGYPICGQLLSDDKLGYFNNFQHGCIYWSESLGAHVLKGVHPQVVHKTQAMSYQNIWRGRTATGWGSFGKHGTAPYDEPGQACVGYSHFMDDPCGPGYEYIGFAYRAELKCDSIQPDAYIKILNAKLNLVHRTTSFWDGDSDTAGAMLPSAATGLYLLDAPSLKPLTLPATCTLGYPMG